MPRQSSEDHVTEEAVGCLLFALGTVIVGSIRVLNSLAAPVPSGIAVGHYGAALGVRKSVGIPDGERLKHTHILGATGSGKTTLLKHLIVQDLQAGHGLAVIDPKGDLIDELLAHVPAHRLDDVVLFDPTDHDHPVGFNMLAFVGEAELSRTASELVSIFKKLFGAAWGQRLEHILRYTALTLLEVPGSTLLDIPDLLLDDDFRHGLLVNVRNFSTRAFWEQEYQVLSNAQRMQAVLPILNRVGPWLAYPEIRNIAGQVHSSFHLRTLMDQGKILLVNIPQGRLGEDASGLLGAMLVSKIQLTAMARAGNPAHTKRPFFLYVDEFQNFVTSSFEKILTEARSFGLGLVVANQYPEQLTPSLRLALANNVAVQLSCYLERGHYRIRYQTPQNQQAAEWVLQPRRPLDKGNPAQAKQIRRTCRLRYGRPRREVEQEIRGRQRRRQRTTEFEEAGSFWGEA